MKRTFFLFLGVCFAVCHLNAQMSVDIEVKDKLENPIAEALIVLEFQNGQKKLSRFTDDEGKASFQGLDPGTYLLSADGGLRFYTQEKTVVLTESSQQVKFELLDKNWQLPDVYVSSDRAGHLSPVAFENIEGKTLSSLADGREIPMILQGVTSLVSHSDAGNGVGYTYMRIRGSDQTRINVTINGIPLNDSESHQVFWVNLPDFSDNLSSVQVQRGVGQSTFGPGAFGANMKLSTAQETEDFVRIRSHVGSYSTLKNSIALQHNGLQFRFSKISSDGYIDRAESDLESYFAQYEKKFGRHRLKLMHANGKERTYQSWNGAPESKAEENDEKLEAHIARNNYTPQQIDNLTNSDRRYNIYEYEDEVDDYNQIHNQIHWAVDLNAPWALSSTVHYTYGKGYFEQFREDLSASAFGLNPRITGNDTLAASDAAFRRWLDNDFYGVVLNAVRRSESSNIKASIFASQYEGDHFGRVIRADFIEKDETPQYYSSYSKKRDYSSFVQLNQKLGRWLTTLDLQVRHIDYRTYGNDNDLKSFDIDQSYWFFNPKVGIQRNMGIWRAYGHGGIGNREPVRSDFIDRDINDQPKPEQVMDLELGLTGEGENGNLSVNLFYMNYKDQLVPTGELNDVGALVRRNIAESFRGGIEVALDRSFLSYWKVKANMTWMNSKIRDWNEPIVDYATGETTLVNYEETSMALSPDFQSYLELQYQPLANFSIALQNQWVGEQYLDNTENANRTLDAYIVQNLRLAYTFDWVGANIGLSFACYNLLDQKYSGFGYSYSYAYAGEITTENFVYPQAERNFNLGLSIKF